MINLAKKGALVTQVDNHDLALLVQAALEFEVSLTPKPGLVDRLTNGSHTDMNYDLFIASAQALTPYFTQMAVAGSSLPIGDELRTVIAVIGRRAETAMYAVTNGVNTHKGAIWALGILVTIAAYIEKHQLASEQIFSLSAALVSKIDLNAPQLDYTHGALVTQKYGINGAYTQARNGFKDVQAAIKFRQSLTTGSCEHRALRTLLFLMSTLDDTCVLFRSDLETLKAMQRLAMNANTPDMDELKLAQLTAFCGQKKISPGGSADLLAATYFIMQWSEQRSVCPDNKSVTTGA